MNVARILYPVQVLGPGKRIGIWVCGCNRKCPGCSNPELWKQKEEYEIQISQLLDLFNHILLSNPIDGFTISGGEPFLQPEELSSLIEEIALISRDILIYTGFTLQELHDLKNPFIEKTLSTISVLIDGPYIQEKNNDLFLRGSENQQIHILNPLFHEMYSQYLMVGKNKIQNFMSKEGVISVGIHRRDFSDSSAS